MKVKVINKSKHQLPEYATIASAGLDLRANISEPIIFVVNVEKIIIIDIITQIDFFI